MTVYDKPSGCTKPTAGKVIVPELPVRCMAVVAYINQRGEVPVYILDNGLLLLNPAILRATTDRTSGLYGLTPKDVLAALTTVLETAIANERLFAIRSGAYEDE
jgi:hypothetical protein